MKRLLSILLVALVISSCSKVGNIDESRLSGQTDYRLSTGQTVTLPIEYKHWQWMMATYSVPVEQIQALLPEKLKPILVTPNQALISFGVLEYPDVSSLKPYDEWLISIPVQYDPSFNAPFLPALYNPLFPHSVYKKGGSYIYHLPVTTQESHLAGMEIWGFPKVHRSIRCRETETVKSCDLLKGSDLVMTLDIEKWKLDADKQTFAYCAYTEKDKELLRTCLMANGRMDYSLFGNAKVRFGQGEIAEQMKQLTLDTDSPLQVFFAEDLSSQLPLEYERLEK